MNNVRIVQFACKYQSWASTEKSFDQQLGNYQQLRPNNRRPTTFTRQPATHNDKQCEMATDDQQRNLKIESRL